MLWHTGKSFRHAVRILPLLARDRSARGAPRPATAAPALRVPPLALAVLLGSVAVTGSPSWARDAAEAPKPADTPSAADGPQALIASLRSRILAAHSATFALESWCADYKLAGDPHLVAERVPWPTSP